MQGRRQAGAGTRELPVTVLGGYLGAGKTTLLNHLLRQANGRRLAVLVNDFGDIGIDAALIEARGEDLLELAGGCVCCSFGSDLVGALRKIAARQPQPDHVVIETSGVALPAPVAQAVGLVPGLRSDATVVVCDADTVRLRRSDRYVGDIVAAQLAQADLIVLNKLDLVAAPARAALQDWLAGLHPGVDIVGALEGSVPVELLLGWPEDAPAQQEASPQDPREAGVRAASAQPETLSHRAATLRKPHITPGRFSAGDEAGKWRSGHAAGSDGVFTSASFAIERPVDVRRLAGRLADQRHGLLRAKGVLHDSGGGVLVLQLVGSRIEVRGWQPPAGHDGRAGVLACIGLRERLDREAVVRSIDLAAQQA
jgi:G3E family GTPase